MSVFIALNTLRGRGFTRALLPGLRGCVAWERPWHVFEIETLHRFRCQCGDSMMQLIHRWARVPAVRAVAIAEEDHEGLGERINPQHLPRPSCVAEAADGKY